MRKIIFIIAYFSIINTNAFAQINADDRTSKGTDFWMAFMPNVGQYWTPGGGTQYYTETILYISTDNSPSQVVVSMPQQGVSFDEIGNTYTTDYIINIPANSTAEVNIPYEFSIASPTGNGTDQQQWVSEVTDDPRGIHIRSLDNPVALYALNTNLYSADATIIYPTITLGHKYYTLTTDYNYRNNSLATSVSEFIVVATEDNTTIDITLSENSVLGTPANSTITVTLDAGEVYQVQSLYDISASYIYAHECKPIAVFSGDTYTGIPNITGMHTRDHLFEHMTPVQNWGRRFISAPFLTRERSDIYAAIASADNTELHVFSGDGEQIFFLDQGEKVQFMLDIEPDMGYYFEASQPIELMHYSATGAWDNVDASDPFMDLLPSIEQSINTITFNAFSGSSITNYYLNVFAPANAINTVYLDGISIENEFIYSSIYGTDQFLFARIPINEGNHILESEVGIQANVYGYESMESYGYIAGTSARPLNLDFDISFRDETSNYMVYSDTACVNDTIILYALDLPEITNYEWQFANRSVIGDTAWVISPIEQEINFSLVGTKDGECYTGTDTLFKTIFIQEYLNPSIDVIDSICSYGDTLNITALPFGGSLYIDNSLDSVITTDEYPIGSHILSYEVTTSAGCLSTAYDTVEILDLITPEIHIFTDTNNVCPGTTITVDIESQLWEGDSATYHWYVNDTLVSTDSSFSSNNFRNNDWVRLTMISSAHCRTVDSVSDSIQILLTEPTTPNISIQSDVTEICDGMPVLFSIESEENEGDTPLYQWQVNGVNIPATDPTYMTDTLRSEDVVSLILKSSETCVTTDTASDRLLIIVNPLIEPQIRIAPNNENLCEGSVDTVSIIDSSGGGTAPTFRWFINGLLQTETGTSIILNPANSGMEVSIEMTSTEECAQPSTATHDTIIRMTPLVTPEVEIVADTNNVCEDTPIPFSIVNIAHEGTNPNYHWYINDTLVSTGNSYISSELNNNDIIKLTLISDAYCRTIDSVSSQVQVNIISKITPHIEIEADQSLICYGTPVNYSISNIENEGITPSYRWQLNGIDIPGVSNSATSYSDSNIENGDIVSVILTTSETCITTDTASDRIPMNVNYIIIPSVSIDADQDLCEGMNNTIHIIDSTGGGTAPTFSWTLNGTSIPGAGSSITIDTLSNGDIVEVTMTSNATCANPTIATDDVTISVIPLVTPDIDIDGLNRICAEELIQYEVIGISNEGDNPTINWLLNGAITTKYGLIYQDTINIEGEYNIRSILHSNLVCVTTDTASDASDFTVIALIEPFVHIDVVDNNLCEYTEITAFISDTSGAGPSPGYNWYINNQQVATDVYSITRNDLAGGTYITAQLNTDVECPLISYVRDSIQVVYSPQPVIITDSTLCLEDNNSRINFNNALGTGGAGDFENALGLHERTDYAMFVPEEAGLGLTTLELHWTDTNNCQATTTYPIMVRSIEPPTPVDENGNETHNFEDILTVEPHHNLFAEGWGTVNWYDMDTVLLRSGIDEYQPTRPCNENECIQYFLINQVDPIYGCESDFVPITYTMTTCEVPAPTGFSNSMCDYWTSLTLEADTAQTWNFGSPMGTSTLHWYLNSRDSSENYILTGETFDPMPYIDGQDRTFYVRQYSPGWNCYSPIEEIRVTVYSTPAPNVSNNVRICEGEAIPQLRAFGNNITWYATNDTNSTPLSRSNYYTPSNIPVDQNTRFYATQRLHPDSCQSEPTDILLYISLHATSPIPDNSENCENIPYIFTTPQENGQSVVWLNSLGGLLEDSDEYDTTLVLRKRWLRPNDITYFNAYATNDLGCNSDTVRFEYKLISIPPTPQRLDNNSIFCFGKELNPKLEAFTAYDSLVWYNSLEERKHNGDDYLPEISTPGEFDYYVFAYNEYCRSIDSLPIHLSVGIQPKADIVGKRHHCAYTYHHSFVDTSYTPDTRYEWSVTGDRVASTADESGKIYYIDWDEPGIDTISLIEINKYGCVDSSSFIVSIAEAPVAEFEPTNLEASMSVIFENLSSQNDIIEPDSTIPITLTTYWNYGRETDIFDNIHSWEQFSRVDTVNYPYGYWTINMKVVNSYGCVDSISKEIFVDLEHALYIPNIFQPGHFATGVSHYSPKGYNLATYEISIFDIWGNLLWYSNKLTKQGIPAESWDGTYEGIPLKTDSYIWKIEATFRDGEVWKGIEHNGKYYKYGTVVLLR